MTDTTARAWHSIFVRQSSSESYGSDSLDSVDFYESPPPPPKLIAPGLVQSDTRSRELGTGIATQRKLAARTRRDFKSWRSWTGASKDVLSVAWAADDSSFAIGSSADHLDSHGTPYNRNNNLLFGNVETDSLFELPDHHISRAGIQAPAPSPESHLTDPRLFCAIGQVSFGTHHPTLCTAGYDKTVRVWDVTNSKEKPKCRYTLPHDGFVDFAVQMPARSLADPQLLVTGQQSRVKPSIQLFGLPEIDAPREELAAAYEPIASFASERAQRFPVFPSAIEWGPDSFTRRYLLAGFAEHSATALKEREGHLALWDVTQPRETLLELRNNIELVFDVAWQPGRAVIAAATTARNTKNLSHQFDTKSVVRTWSPTENASRVYELECPARDVNELKFHPTRTLVTASCTDGRTYVWDFRMVDRILMTLNHSEPIETFDSSIARLREELDVGVRFSAWAQNNRYLYTGGSDGRLLCWDVLACEEGEEALVQEVARFDAGIMAGAFSKDESKLLLGLVKGSVEILSIGACSKSEAAKDRLTAVSRTELSGTFNYIPNEPKTQEEESETFGIETARTLMQTEQLVLTKYGVMQGPRYSGPWSRSARPPGTTDFQATPLLPDVAIQQFDKKIRRDGRSRCPPTVTANPVNRELAKKLYAIAKERERDDVVFRTRGNMQDSTEDRVKGPGECELSSLSQLTLLVSGSTTPTTHRATLSPQVKSESGWALPPKRPADATYDLPARKRTGTPGSNVTGFGEASTADQPLRAPAAERTRPNAYANERPNGTRGTVSTLANGPSRSKPDPLEIIEISSDDDDPREITALPAAATSSTTTHPAPTPSTRVPPARSSPVRQIASGGQNSFKIPSTPSKSPAAINSPTTPQRSMSSTESEETQSSQRSILPTSQGKDGFQRPGRVVTTPTPERQH